MAIIAETLRKESAMSRTTAVTFGFSDELDFLLNYDIKYRLGRESESEGE